MTKATRVVIYISHEKMQMTCNFGDKHNVTIYTKKFLYPTGETYGYDNGYTKDQGRVYKDGQGRTWKSWQTIDFYGGTNYTCENGMRANSSRPYNGVEK